jgi:hypothetical protein
MERGWASLRETLQSQGVEPAQAAVAVIYPDDVTILEAVVVASADRMVRAEVDYPVATDHSEAMDHGHVVSWEDDSVVIRAEEQPFVDLALELLTSGSLGD